MDASRAPSAAILAANKRLQALRANRQRSAVDGQRSTVSGQRSAVSHDHGLRNTEHGIRNTEYGPPITDHRSPLTALPPHLGWGSAPLTRALRGIATLPEEKQRPSTHHPPPATRCPDEPRNTEYGIRNTEYGSPTTDHRPPTTDHQPHTVKLYPDIAIGMLRQEQAAAGRIWLLLRHLDPDGRGWLRIVTVRERLTRPNSPLRVCGWRQLRNLFRQGEGVFWHRDEERLWLRSAAKVAIALDVERLTGRPVALPVSALLDGVGEAKAHFYASFHSGRRRQNPISRQTLEEITDVPPATQRLYERRAGVDKQRHIAVGERHSAATVEKRAWLHGAAIFDFIDHHGRQGPEKRHYIAWHLPNSYTGCHPTRPKGRQKKINRQIDLVNSRAQGNDLPRRLFHSNGAQASKAYTRNPAVDAYWHSENGRRRHTGLWYVLPREETV